MNQAERAEIVARTAFADDWDTLVHTIEVVAELGPDATDEEKALGWLHDVVEDTSVGLEDLRDMRFTDNVIFAVELVSRTKGSNYDAYKWRIINAPNEYGRIARKGKLADARVNLRRCERATGVPKWQRLADIRYRPMIEELEKKQ